QVTGRVGPWDVSHRIDLQAPLSNISSIHCEKVDREGARVMSDMVEELVDREYAFGFHTDLDTEMAPKGLSEDVVRLISAKKQEPDWLLEWRLGAFRHFLTLEEPKWPNLQHPPIDYQDTHYWAAPKPKPQLASL